MKISPEEEKLAEREYERCKAEYEREKAQLEHGSDRWLTSSDYLVFKNLNVSYALPQKWVRALDMNQLSIGFSVDNLFTITARKGMNPQYSFSGGQSLNFVTARVFSFQINAKF